MTEVRRWKLKGFIPGIEGETKAVFQPTVVLEEDYDAALAREAALREELEATQALSVENLLVDIVPGLDGMGEEVYAKSVAETQLLISNLYLETEDLQQRLTVAEQFVKKMIDCSKGQDSIATGYLSDILDALKPAEGEGS